MFLNKIPERQAEKSLTTCCCLALENIRKEIEKQGRFFAVIGAPGKVHVKRSPDRRGPKGRRGLAPGMTGVDGENGIPGAKGESGIRVAMQGNKDETEITELLAPNEIPDVIEEKASVDTPKQRQLIIRSFYVEITKKISM